MTTDILIVDDEDDIRGLIQGLLEDEGYNTRSAANSTQAYAAIEERVPSLIVQDIWLQGSKDDGLQILKTVKEQYPALPFVMISGHGTIETAVSSIKDGAYDFIEKPFKSDRLLLMIKRALETASLMRENAVLKKQTRKDVSLIGSSSQVEHLKGMISRVAVTNSRVLITGEQGTGKDIIARLIHTSSERADKPFMVLNCATLRPENLEIELFGRSASHKDGELSGILEQSNGGTLLLDEIGDMPLETQAKIVRVLQEQRFQKIGAQDFIEVDIRVLASTHKDLEKLCEEELFRQDLYYRLNVVPLHMPPLRERKSDVESFCNEFIKELYAQRSETPVSFSAKALQYLKTYSWPGNIRQLRNVIEWVLIMHGGKDLSVFEPAHLPPEISGISSQGGEQKGALSVADDLFDLSLRDAREKFEKDYLTAQVERFDGNISKTAQFIGMERSALHRKLKSLEVSASEKDENVTSIDEKKIKRA